MPPPKPGALSADHRRLTYAACAALYLTGLGWLAGHYVLASPSDAARAPLELWSLRLHGAAAMAFLVAFGSLLPGHVAQGWKLGRNVGMGAALLTAALLLGASGWGLYYAGGETLREWLSTGHWAVGLGTGPLLALHVFVGRRTALWK